MIPLSPPFSPSFSSSFSPCLFFGFFIVYRDKSNGKSNTPLCVVFVWFVLSLGFLLCVLPFFCFSRFPFFFSCSLGFFPFFPPPARLPFAQLLWGQRSIGVVTVDSNGVGRSIQWRNASAFNGRAVVEEEDKRTVTSQNDSVFPFYRCFQFGPRNSVLLQSSP